MVQYIIVAIILLAAVAWTILKTREAFKESKSGCYGCKGCAFKEQVMKNHNYKEKGERPHCYNKK